MSAYTTGSAARQAGLASGEIGSSTVNSDLGPLVWAVALAAVGAALWIGGAVFAGVAGGAVGRKIADRNAGRDLSKLGTAVGATVGILAGLAVLVVLQIVLPGN